MPIYYVKPDSDNQFPDKDTAPFLKPADGLRAVDIPFSSVQYFTRRWWMYRFKSDNSQEMVSPGNLYPDMDIDYLRELTDQQAKVIETQGKQLETANTELKASQNAVTQLQQMAVQSSQAQAQSLASEGEMKTMLIQITQTIAKQQADDTKTTE
ncbi:hypothetical protein [Levilactobacillus brevis]|uniref:hypothetical protein n=1 Tax=Levilactobacillus brevis TaxID=1580 RepID=UPI0021A94E40|nr:hypothetical protein [Levilactobacillus brevis]MCT3574114.1 hypothetical protein [Levilactobacillus brevis]